MQRGKEKKKSLFIRISKHVFLLSIRDIAHNKFLIAIEILRDVTRLGDINFCFFPLDRNLWKGGGGYPDVFGLYNESRHYPVSHSTSHFLSTFSLCHVITLNIRSTFSLGWEHFPPQSLWRRCCGDDERTERKTGAKRITASCLAFVEEEEEEKVLPYITSQWG